MAINNILVVYNGSESSDATLIAGIIMQKKYSAHITGLYLSGPSQLSSNLKPWAPSDVRESVNEIEANSYLAAKNRFMDMTQIYGLPDMVHWIAEPKNTELTVMDYSRFFDITLIGRPDAYDERFSLSDPEQVARESARPVLVIPKNFEQKLFTNNAVVAWDGSRSVTRALASAMDILALREQVTLLSVGNPKTHPTQIDIQTSLSRHGVNTSVATLKRVGQFSVEELILDFCHKYKPGLLVLGLSEENRFSLKKPANLTANILTKVSMPVFVSA